MAEGRRHIVCIRKLLSVKGICRSLIDNSCLFCRMKKRPSILPLVLLALVFAAFLIRRWNEPKRREEFDRKPLTLVYSKHALCQMSCEQICQPMIREIMAKGLINFNHSDRRYKPCPVFALQGKTTLGKYIQVYFQQCNTKTTVLACYNLRSDTVCTCTGIETKSQR